MLSDPSSLCLKLTYLTHPTLGFFFFFIRSRLVWKVRDLSSYVLMGKLARVQLGACNACSCRWVFAPVSHIAYPCVSLCLSSTPLLLHRRRGRAWQRDFTLYFFIHIWRGQRVVVHTDKLWTSQGSETHKRPPNVVYIFWPLAVRWVRLCPYCPEY